jgi:hypothetical protein
MHDETIMNKQHSLGIRLAACAEHVPRRGFAYLAFDAAPVIISYVYVYLMWERASLCMYTKHAASAVERIMMEVVK